MARTKQTARKNTGGKAPRQERNRGGNLKRTVITQEVLTTKRKERREKKMKLVHDKPIDHSGSTFSDLTIKFQTQENVEEIELFQHLKVKMNNHVCGERCFTEIPKINYALLNTKDDCAFQKVLIGVGPCYSICDEECPKADKKFAFEIFEEFVKEQDEFESSLKEVEIYTDEELEEEFIFLREENEHKIKSSTMEYRKCGKMCFHKKMDLYEIVILLINEFEYFYFGQSEAHAFYGVPGLCFINSDGSAADVTQLFPKKVNDSFIPIPLNELLGSAKNYLGKLLSNGYH